MNAVTQILQVFAYIVAFDRRVVEVVEVVDDRDTFDVCCKQSINEMRTDEAGAASNEKVFHSAFCSINPQVPAPFCGQFRFERARQHGAEYWKPALVEEVSAEFDVCEVFEEFACFAARIDSCRGVAGTAR